MSLVDILNAILPVYLLIALGFVAVLLGWFPKAGVPGVGRFVRNFALPSAVFLVVVQRDISDVVHPGFMLAFGLASILSFGISLTLARRMGGTAPEVHNEGMCGARSYVPDFGRTFVHPQCDFVRESPR